MKLNKNKVFSSFADNDNRNVSSQRTNYKSRELQYSRYHVTINGIIYLRHSRKDLKILFGLLTGHNTIKNT